MRKERFKSTEGHVSISWTTSSSSPLRSSLRSETRPRSPPSSGRPRSAKPAILCWRLSASCSSSHPTVWSLSSRWTRFLQLKLNDKVVRDTRWIILTNLMLMKGRKVGGREETDAHYAFGPLEDDVIIKHRLLTRTTTTRGEPPLKKLQKKFISFALEVEKDSDNCGDCERLYKASLQEMSSFELPLLKSKAVVDAKQREKENLNDLQEQIQHQMLQAQADIEDLKKQLTESKIDRKHKEECEAIRRLIALQPLRSETQKIISDLEKEISSLEAENIAGVRTLDLRKKQFCLLLHVVDELQNTIEDEQRSLADKLRNTGRDQEWL